MHRSKRSTDGEGNRREVSFHTPPEKRNSGLVHPHLIGKIERTAGQGTTNRPETAKMTEIVGHWRNWPEGVEARLAHHEVHS